MIIGNGPLLLNLYQLAERLGCIDVIEFAGALCHDEISKKIHEANIFVLASTIANDGDMDGIPVVLMEAMASGVPVISTNLSGIPELIKHDESGLLVSPHQFDHLAFAIEKLLNDRYLSQRLASNGKQRVANNFNIEIQSLKLLGIIQKYYPDE